jgi:vacuolar-type H+-ATPase subunit I/STV1
MNLEMSYLEIICLKSDLSVTVSALQQLGRVQIDDIREAKELSIRPMTVDPEILHTQDELNLLATQLNGIIDELGIEQTAPSISVTDDFIPDAKSGISELTRGHPAQAQTYYSIHRLRPREHVTRRIGR